MGRQATTGVEAWLGTDGQLNLRNVPTRAGANIQVGVAAGETANLFGWSDTLVTGRLRLEASDTAGAIALELNETGRPADLSRLGLATGCTATAGATACYGFCRC